MIDKQEYRIFKNVLIILGIISILVFASMPSLLFLILLILSIILLRTLAIELDLKYNIEEE